MSVKIQPGGIVMKLQPIVRVKLAKFREDYELQNVSEGVAFERFANQVILSTHQPGAFSVDDSLMDTVCVGGQNDMGLVGICIKLNGFLVHTLQDAKDIFERYNKADIEFIFIQSKYKEKFDSGEYAKFANGVVDFLGEDHFQPNNDNIQKWLSIKEYLMSDQVMMRWTRNPDVRLYYVVMGTWEESPHIIAISQKIKKDIALLETYGDIAIQYIDTSSFKRIIDENENAFSVVLNVIDTFSLTAVDNVENSSIILCNATELLKLLVSEEGLIRKSLFDDNVRDYQGDTTINQDILTTIENDPFSFVLLNNGITIVCDEIGSGNRKITIKNPQVVNGCQTCNVIYEANKKGYDLSNVTIIAKVIATRCSEITNSIVKGTNRQNIVYDEAFEITRQFHKDLEDLFNALATGTGIRLFYERRSKQYFNNPTIKPFEKVNLRGILQSFVSIFLNEPFKGHRHESKLLQEYRNKIFVDSQSKYPYYMAALIFSMIDHEYRANTIPKELAPYRMHICWLVKELLAPNTPTINNEKEIDNYCTQLKEKLLDEKTWDETLKKTCQLFTNVQQDWIEEKGDSYRYGMKDSIEFFNHLREHAHARQKVNIIEDKPLQYRGTVIKTRFDKNGRYYGFISRLPDNIFFHEQDNPSLNFSNLYAHEVLYSIAKDKFGNDKAIDVVLV